MQGPQKQHRATGQKCEAGPYERKLPIYKVTPVGQYGRAGEQQDQGGYSREYTGEQVLGDAQHKKGEGRQQIWTVNGPVIDRHQCESRRQSRIPGYMDWLD